LIWEFFSFFSFIIIIYTAYITIRTYDVTAWNRFYIFDVYNLLEHRYESYEDYQAVIEEYNSYDCAHFDYIPLLKKLEHPSESELGELMEQNQYLMPAGSAEVGEGLVLKNYAFVNRYGRLCYAKMVRSEFKAKVSVVKNPDKLTGYAWYQALVGKYFDSDAAQHVYVKLADEGEVLTARFIETCWHDFIEERLWDIVKQEHNPVIDFKTLRSAFTAHLRDCYPAAFVKEGA
jgi:hypothetical protein